ncbi:Ig-like domain-containing protein [Sabulibacter ruber]|uniref:Ig-like domain-containing protein n=1 Tax=Sabulibacter ruber TaxID=2811901 RepID=UPI001A96837E
MDAPYSNFFLEITNREARGTIILREQKKLYRYSSTSDGSVYLTEEDIDKVLCIGFQEEKQTLSSSIIQNSTVAAATPLLESFPGASAVLYLDFDGQTVTNTYWNSHFNSGNPIVAAPANLSASAITEIWKIISEDYRPFGLNVTTSEAVFNSAPLNRRMRVIFTPTNYFYPNAGGVAYVGSFTWGTSRGAEHPCWVFNSSIKGAGDCGSHESGHTLGLGHDGRTTPTEAYFQGQDSWAPIMGTSYYRSVAQWSKGEYSYADNTEDDLYKIATMNGFSYRADDHGNVNSTATPLKVDESGRIVETSNKGIIGTRTDVDVFSFTSIGGTVTLTVSPNPNYPNLDILLTLRNGANTVVAKADPTTLDASLSVTLPAGTYYLAIDGTKGSLGADSDYASLGEYTVSGLIPNGSPSISITSPTAGANFNAPASFSIAASATDTDGSITKVEFFQGTTKLGEDLSAPYSFSWNGVAAGTYSLTAKATDNSGKTTTSAPVTVSSVVPSYCAATYSTGCSAADFINNFSFHTLANNNSGCSNGTSPGYTSYAPTGALTTTVTRGQTYRVSIQSGASYAQGFGIWIDYNNDKDFADQGEFVYATPSYSTTAFVTNITIPVTASVGSIRMRVRSKYEAIFSSTEYCSSLTYGEAEDYTISIVNTPPAVTLSSPSAGSSFTAPATISMAASANDPDGRITKVEFFRGTTKLGEDLTAPYTFTWTGVPSGTYSLTAKAFDNSAATATSTPVSVTAHPSITSDTQWNYRFGGSGNDLLTVMIKTTDGGYLLGGTSSSSISGDKTEDSRGGKDFWIVKISSAGTKQWDRRFGGTADEELNSLIETTDGGYLLGGYSASGIGGDKSEAGRGGKDFWVVKVSSAGTKLWDKRFGGSADEDLRSVLQTRDGGYLLAGTSLSGAGGDKSEVSRGGIDYWVVKINSTGTKLWNKRFGGSAHDELTAALETVDGSLLLGGYSASGTSGDRKQASQGLTDYWIVKLSSTGSKQWDKRFGGTAEDVLQAITPTTDGGFLLGGSSFSGKAGDKSEDSKGNKDFWVLKVSSSGNKEWDKGMGGIADDELRSLLITSDGGYLLAGSSASGISGDKTDGTRGGKDYWVVKATENGAKLWDKTYGGASDEELRTILQTSDGAYLLGGLSASGVSGDRTQPTQGLTDYWIVKAGPSTNQAPTASAGAVDKSPTAHSPEHPENTLSTAPNPFTEKITLQFKLAHQDHVTLKVFNEQGLEVASLYEGEGEAGRHYSYEWNAKQQKPGVYIIRLVTTAGKTIHRKVVLIR